MTYYAIAATKSNETVFVVVSNLKTSLAVMSDMQALGNKVQRFTATAQNFIDYSEGKNFTTEYTRANTGRTKITLVVK